MRCAWELWRLSDSEKTMGLGLFFVVVLSAYYPDAQQQPPPPGLKAISLTVAVAAQRSDSS